MNVSFNMNFSSIFFRIVIIDKKYDGMSATQSKSLDRVEGTKVGQTSDVPLASPSQQLNVPPYHESLPPYYIVMDPPSYASVILQPDQSEAQSSTIETGNSTSAAKVCKTAILQTKKYGLYAICSSIFIITPAIQLLYGIEHKDNCSMNNLIPIYLIVSGVLGLASIVIVILVVNVFF